MTVMFVNMNPPTPANLTFSVNSKGFDNYSDKNAAVVPMNGREGTV